MTLAQRIKSGLSRTLGAVGRVGLLDWCEGWALSRAGRLLDPAVLPPVAVPRKLRGLALRPPCNPHNPFHRSLYWFGRLHERGLENLLRGALRPGDTFLDIGANYGHFSFLTAALVGPSGRVYAFEPHPELAAQVADQLRRQGVAQAAMHAVALGARSSEAVLRVNPRHIGASTVRSLEGDDNGRFVQEFRVPVVRCDDLLAGAELPGRVIVKVDVEGHEPAVIEGAAELLRSRASALVLEVTPRWLGGAEGTASLFARLDALGFDSFGFDESGAGPLLSPLDDPRAIADQINVAFVKRGSDLYPARPGGGL